MTKYDRTGLGASGDFSRGNLADELREKDKIIESLEKSIGVLGQKALDKSLRIQELEEENEAYKKSIDGRDMTAGNQADYIAKLQGKIEELHRNNDDQAKTIDKLTERLGYDVDSPYIEAEAKELEDLEDEIIMLKSKLEQLNERIALLTAEKDVSLKNHTDIVNELREDLEVMTLHRNNLQKERLEHIKEIEVLKSTSNVNVTIEGLAAELRDKNKKIIELEEAGRKLGDYIKCLQESKSTLIEESVLS